MLWLGEGFPGGELENGGPTTGGTDAERGVLGAPDGGLPGREAALAALEEKARKSFPSGGLEKAGASGAGRACPFPDGAFAPWNAPLS